MIYCSYLNNRLRLILFVLLRIRMWRSMKIIYKAANSVVAGAAVAVLVYCIVRLLQENKMQQSRIDELEKRMDESDFDCMLEDSDDFDDFTD